MCFAKMVYQHQSQVCLQKYYTRHDAKIMFSYFWKITRWNNELWHMKQCNNMKKKIQKKGIRVILLYSKYGRIAARHFLGNIIRQSLFIGENFILSDVLQYSLASLSCWILNSYLSTKTNVHHRLNPIQNWIKDIFDLMKDITENTVSFGLESMYRI